VNKRWVSFFLLSLLLLNEGQAGLFDTLNPETTRDTKDATDIEVKKAELQNRLAEVEKRYGQTAASLKTLQMQIEQSRHNLGRNQQDRANYQKEIDKYGKELATQIKAAYAMGQKEKLKIILNQQDPVLSSRMMLYYNYINKARLKKLSAAEAAIKQQAQLEQQKATDTQILEKSLQQKQAEQAVLDETEEQRTELVELLHDFSSRRQQLKDLKAGEQKLKGLLTTLQDSMTTKTAPIEKTTQPTIQTDSNFDALKGQLTLPVNGAARKFGIARAKGVLINAEEGTEVRAIAKGKVAYADLLQGYGSLIIIDHGQDYMTMYGFNQSLYKKVGDTVEAGDVIATVGKSGGRKQSGLYFAIRKQGMPIDPLGWCVKPNTNK